MKRERVKTNKKKQGEKEGKKKKEKREAKEILTLDVYNRLPWG